jgi:hypothetical protein
MAALHNNQQLLQDHKDHLIKIVGEIVGVQI